MFICEVCKMQFKNLNLLQRHFSFKNGKEPRHQIFKAQQIILAEEIFLNDKSGDTFHILKQHPEINLISEKFLRKVWINKYGKDNVEKRRIEISLMKRTELIYNPRKIEKEIGLDKKCPVCEFKYDSETTINHHISSKRDNIHNEFFEQQRSIAENIFIEDKINNIQKIKDLHPEFILSENVLRTFWVKKYGQIKVSKRKDKISANSRLGLVGWSSGLNKNNNESIKKMSITRKELYKDGIPHLNTEENADKERLAYAEGRKIPPSLIPGVAKKISRTMLDQYADGSRKPNHGKGGFRADIGLSIRSKWEANIIRVLIYCKREFEYEKSVFSLRNNDGIVIDNYFPDIFFPKRNFYLEIKGVFKSATDWSGLHKNYQENAIKINMFKKQYPDVKLKIFGKKEYDRILRWFEHKVENLEFPKDFKRTLSPIKK